MREVGWGKGEHGERVGERRTWGKGGGIWRDCGLRRVEKVEKIEKLKG